MLLTFALALTLGCGTATTAEAKNEKSGQKPKGKAIVLPGYSIDLAKREVRMEAEVCLEQGILEYLACTPGTFEHESIVVTSAKPELLHTALLLIGLTPTPRFNTLGSLAWEMTGKEPTGLVKIDMEWEEDGKPVRVNLHRLLINREEEEEGGEAEEIDESNPGPYWVFTGSFFHKMKDKEVYAANLSGVVVAIWPSPASVIQYGKKTLNPYRGEDHGLEINTETCPPKGTKVKLIFTPYTKPKAHSP
jgi:hypothetical protein